MMRPALAALGIQLCFLHRRSGEAFRPLIRPNGSCPKVLVIADSKLTLFSQKTADESHSSTHCHGESIGLNPAVASQFKLLTCCSTACTKSRRSLQQDDIATFASFYSRIQEYAPTMKIEECPCLGSCKNAPCVAIEHDDFEGPVAVEGMDRSEFSERVFHRVHNDADIDRVWSAVESAINFMVKEEGDNNHDEIDENYV